MVIKFLLLIFFFFGTKKITQVKNRITEKTHAETGLLRQTRAGNKYDQSKHEHKIETRLLQQTRAK